MVFDFILPVSVSLYNRQQTDLVLTMRLHRDFGADVPNVDHVVISGAAHPLLAVWVETNSCDFFIIIAVAVITTDEIKLCFRFTSL